MHWMKIKYNFCNYIVCLIALLCCNACYVEKPDLPPPENITATPGVEKITLDWSLVPDADFYEVCWTTIKGDYIYYYDRDKLNPIKVVLPPYEHVNLTPGVTYYHYVVSRSGDFGNELSKAVEAIPLPPPE